MVTGPFEFDKEKMHHIPEAAWKELLKKAEEYQADAADINVIKPLNDHRRRTSRKNIHPTHIHMHQYISVTNDLSHYTNTQVHENYTTKNIKQQKQNASKYIPYISEKETGTASL
jgi:hypothetical protein